MPSTNLAPPPKSLEVARPPFQQVTSPEPHARNDVPEGRVGRVWYSQRIITESASGSLRPGSGQLHRTSDRSFSDRQGDSRSTLGPGNVIRVKGFDLGSGTFGMTGDFTFHREGETNVYQGTWGGDLKYDEVIKVSRSRVDRSWGFWQRHLEAVTRPQTPPGCVSFENRNGVPASALAAPVNDALLICGSVFDLDAPPQQVLMSFLMAGFRRSDGW